MTLRSSAASALVDVLETSPSTWQGGSPPEFPLLLELHTVWGHCIGGERSVLGVTSLPRLGG